MILSTGIKSGLGRYIYENIDGQGFCRSTTIEEKNLVKQKGVDVIIHCAFSSAKNITSNNLYKYVSDNLFYTQELISIPHKKFIFISTIDVYPKTGNPLLEDQELDVNSLGGIYAITKLMSESVIREHCDNYLILRPSALLGKYSRRNSFIKILEDEDCSLTLTEDSQFNYVLYSDILAFIKLAIKSDIKGVLNVASTGNISLKAVASMLGKTVQFGSFCYEAGDINNNKICSLFPRLQKSSEEAVEQFVKERR